MKFSSTIFLILTLVSTLAHTANDLRYKNLINLQDFKGYSFFAVMQDDIKPRLDQAATEGFTLTTGKKAVAALKLVDSKVSAKAVRAIGTTAKLEQVVEAVRESKPKVTFYELPALLAEEGVGSGRFDLTTYLALVSGGGVAVQLDENNTAYHVNYGTGELENDERTGRSFGESPGRLALDASDKHYLQILESYVRNDSVNIAEFYTTILSVLVKSDASQLSSVTEAGQAVATDFISVYTAEQTRHLMSDLKRHPWDEALLEVTLLAAYHSGQKKFMMMYDGEFTDTTHKQQNGCETEEKVEKRASLIDYWQFSSSTDPAQCSRSGLNVSRKDFRNLEKMISAYVAEQHPELVEKLQKDLSNGKTDDNFYAQLSETLISYDAPEKFGKGGDRLIKNFVEFLIITQNEADEITEYIAENWK